MDDEKLEGALYDLLAAVTIADFDDEPEITVPRELSDLDMVSTLNEQGVLTLNKGLVLRMKSGAEWQVTIVQSG
jgi:hypothetical protein